METDEQFVERMLSDVEDFGFESEDIERMRSLALRGAKVQWRPIKQAKGKSKLGTVAVFGGKHSHSNSPELLTGHLGPSLAKWDSQISLWTFSDWPYGEHIYYPAHFIPLSALGEPEKTNDRT